MSTDLGACALVRENSVPCSAKMDFKVVLCPYKMIILFEDVFLAYSVLKAFSPVWLSCF